MVYRVSILIDHGVMDLDFETQIPEKKWINILKRNIEHSSQSRLKIF